jgi:F420-non-reducing hydrogenase iron-sulfur subunit
MAGVSRLQYSSEIRLVRVMCSGRVDLKFVFRAFADGCDGVFIGGCKLNECNYVTQGNYDALAVARMGQHLLGRIGLDPERLRITFMSGGDGNILAEAATSFSKTIKGLGPLGTGEGVDRELLGLKLEAVERLAPYLRLVERERLRVPTKSKKAYDEFFAGEEFGKLLDDVVGDKLAVSQILLLLGKGPLSTADISARLGLRPSEVSRHMGSSSRHGWVKYDVERKRYALA